MTLDVGTKTIGEIYYGNDAISEVWKGDDLVWSAYAPDVNYIFRDIDENGNLTLATGNLEDSSAINRIGDQGMSCAFYNCTSIVGTVSFPNLKSIGIYGFFRSFQDCASITSVNLASLEKIDNQGLQYCFAGCTNLSSVNLTSLKNIGQHGFLNCFNSCTSLASISFPSLTSGSFGRYSDQFNYMLNRINGCTVHFPSNLQSVIGSWRNVTNGFGGTNTIILFDLPTTE